MQIGAALVSSLSTCILYASIHLLTYLWICLHNRMWVCLYSAPLQLSLRIGFHRSSCPMGKCRPLTNQMPILNATHDMAQLGHRNLNSCQQTEQSTSYITLTNFKENSRTSAGYSPLEGTNKKHRGKTSNLGGTPGPGQSRSLRCTVHQPGHSQREPVFAEELARIHWLRPHCSEQHALWHL